MNNALRPDQVDTTKMPILDVRMKPTAKQIRGALHYDPRQLLEAETLALPLPHEEPVVVYGDSDPIVLAVVDKLRRSGYAGATRLQGGIQGWTDAGLPLEELSVEQPIPGQERAGIERF